MITERIDLWEKDEYNYEAAYGFVPNIRTYMHEDNEERPSILVIPGGAYCMVVPSEGEFIARKFYDRGMNTFVLTYTTDITTAFPLYKQPLKDASRAVSMVRKVLTERGLKDSKIFVMGFSAGGHLAGCMGVHYFDEEIEAAALKGFSNKPDGAILSYPVVTMGEFTESFSKLNLVGPNPTGELEDYFSVEKQVTDKTVPFFIWATAKDGLVSCENSLLLSMALKSKWIMHELHIFNHGDHGLSYPNEEFFNGINYGDYTFEQVNRAVRAVKDGTAVNVTPRRTQELINQFSDEPKDEPKDKPEAPKVNVDEFKDILAWADMAEAFIRKI